MGLDIHLLPQYEGQTLEEVLNDFNPLMHWRKSITFLSWFEDHGTPYERYTNYCKKSEVDAWLLTNDQIKDLLRKCLEDLMGNPGEYVISDLTIIDPKADLNHLFYCRETLKTLPKHVSDPKIKQWLCVASW